MAELEAEKKKQAKTMDDLLKTQTAKQQDFAMCISNNAQAKAFQMAAIGCQTMKDDPAEAQHYKNIMRNIMNGDTVADSEMPPLPGNADVGGDTSAGTNV